MYLINHFLDKLVFGQPAPDVDSANTTNAATGTGSLGTQVDSCTTTYGRAPNFLLVDVSFSPISQNDCLIFVKFYEYGGGSVFEVAASINGVTYSPATPIATPISTTSTSSSSGSSNGASSSFRELLLYQQQFLAYIIVLASIGFGACTVI